MMTTKIKTLAQAIQTKLQSVNNGGTPAVKYFDHVWVGVPKNIPLGDRCVAMVEIASQPNYYYTTCPTITNYDVDFVINIMVKGHVENATLYAYEVVEAVQAAIFADTKISNSCIGSTIEDVQYGDWFEQERSLVTGARLTLRCRL
jgi:hypothetical protein